MTPPLASADLEHVLTHMGDLWGELRGQRLFITGGTGFFGRWLLESFVRANERLGLGARAVVLTRDPATFATRHPELARHPALEFHVGDVRTFEGPPGPFSHVIHAATYTGQHLYRERPLEMLETFILGARRVTAFARTAGARKLLLTSSGTVYGKQPAGLTHLPEDYEGGPDPADPGSVFSEGKRVAELLCALASRDGLECKIARCFTFVGPGLRLDAHFAIGNFIRDALAGGPILVQGDGTPYRSYLYTADLAVWLWTILFRGAAGGAYNVGSDEAITIGHLARCVAETADDWLGHARGATGVRIAAAPVPGRPPQRYVPATTRARSELGLSTWVGLPSAITRTLAWHSGAQEQGPAPP